MKLRSYSERAHHDRVLGADSDKYKLKHKEP